MTHLQAVPFSLEDPDYELASIVADAFSSKVKEKRFGFLRTSGEEVSFISKVYFPLYACHESGTSYVLGCTIFSRTYSIAVLDKAGISALANRTRINEEALGQLVEICGPGDGVESAQVHIPGAYPSSLQGTLRSELSFVRQLEDITVADGTVLPLELSVSSARESISRIRDARESILADKTFLVEAESSMDRGVDSQISAFQKEREALTRSYREHYREAVDAEQQVLKALNEEVEEKIDDAIGAYEDAMGEILEKNDSVRDLLFDIVSKPSMDEPAALEKIAGVRRAISDHSDQDLGGVKGDISYHCDAASKKLAEIGAFKSERQEEITHSSRAIRAEWDEKMKSLSTKVDALRSGHASCIESIHKMLSKKDEELYTIDSTVSMEVAIDGILYLPFYVIGISSGDDMRLVMYPPSSKRDKSKLISMLRSFSMPLAPHTRGASQLAALLQEHIASDGTLRDTIINDGAKYDVLSNDRLKNKVLRGLGRLRDEGLLRDKQYEKIRSIVE